MPVGVQSGIILPDNDAVTLFVHFYKLLFLGTKFSRRMLKVDVGVEQLPKVLQKLSAESMTDDDSAFSDSLILDTSDAPDNESEKIT